MTDYQHTPHLVGLLADTCWRSDSGLSEDVRRDLKAAGDRGRRVLIETAVKAVVERAQEGQS